MRAAAAVLTVLVVTSSATAHAQFVRPPSASSLFDRVSAETSVVAEKAVPGGTVVLHLEVSPDRGIRVFAPGAKKFVPAVVILTRPDGIKSGKPSYDIPDYEKNPGDDKRVPLYGRKFKIDHVVTIDKDVKPGTEIRVSGALTYQACDERIVYPKRTMAVRWTIRVEQPE